MSERTRRQFLEVAGAAAATAVLAPSALASGRVTPVRAAPELPLPALPLGPTAPYSSYQSEIYIGGMGLGTKPPFTTNLAGLEAAAARVLPESARRHLIAAAGGAAAADANVRALDAWRIVPRMFIDREKRDLRTSLLGVTMPTPIILGPVGRQALAHADAEAGSARAAAGLGLTYVHSAQASTPVEGIAAGAPTAPSGSRWFAVDWPDGAPDVALLRRARLAGCTHLVLAPPQPGGSWSALAQIRSAWSGPIVLSGIQNVADARDAVSRGLDGIVVSNERGRRGAKPAGTIDILPRIADAVGSRVPVLFGSGVRTGTDVYRALALGADAVVVGRPYVHGLALGGEGGVRHMLRTLIAELDITLAIAGVASRRDLDPGALVRS
ncbi:L-lactate dehydrogenase [Paraconexibacter sp. AEG42_29]|uniref:L-lactate dehydrogenase n=1 Tax=Paraconexibacter sp. AEG42_29 TaxID=2997339 RepID=A0AAU7AZI8_9ACTN